MTEISSSGSMSLDVLGLINDARMTYGLRHQDYFRYREYCTNRVRRLRQVLKLSQPNNKKVNLTKPLPEEFQDNRYLQLFVYEAERAWAYSMELKQESAQSMETRQRHHLVKRLRRASQHATKLLELCEKQTVDSKTLFDAKAYAALMKGYFLFEQEQWKAALDSFVEARTIYEKFAQYNDDAQKEALCYAAIDEIDPSIRFCAYRLQLETQDAESIAKSHPCAQSLEAELSSKREENTWKGDTLNWRGKEVYLKSQALSEAVRKAQKESAWTKVEKMIKRALKEAKEAKAKVGSSRSEKTVEDLSYLFTWIKYSVYASQIQRHLQNINENQGKRKHTIKSYDEILKNIGYMFELPFVRDDSQFETELSVLSFYFKGCRGVEIALVYNEMGKAAESLALYERCETYAVQAKQALGHLDQFSEDSMVQVSEQDILRLEQTVRTSAWKSRAAWHLENENETVTEQMKELNINNDYLVDHLDTYPSQIGDLVQLPPTFQPVSCKPFYFDLAANHIKYPEQSLKERTEKTASGGIWGLFGKGW
ncbi:hypothetical protein BY458DRAFT_501462 [Sporodiniella umbellata]|nr:hypothetical protein BY458DRAFT_501462 [Sporodiniella umbellata]